MTSSVRAASPQYSFIKRYPDTASSPRVFGGRIVYGAVAETILALDAISQGYKSLNNREPTPHVVAVCLHYQFAFR